MVSLRNPVPKFACVVAVLTGVCVTAPLHAADNQGTWSVAAQMTAARTEIGGVALNGKIYVAGGQEMGRPDSTLFQMFDPASLTWKDLAPMPKGASHVGLAVLDGKIYVAGGFAVRPHNDPIDQFAVYDPATNKWQTLAPLPMKLGSVSLAGVQGKIHALWPPRRRGYRGYACRVRSEQRKMEQCCSASGPPRSSGRCGGEWAHSRHRRP
jgi:hypothetical protein